jgi:putative acetyltransferase
MKIRPEIPEDAAAISSVISAAFLKAEHSGGNEARIVDALRQANSLTVSLVAAEDAAIIGYIAFSPVTVDGRGDGWFGLGPVAVMPDRQREGIGSALINAGLRHLRGKGSNGCVVLGDPAYYHRFGFSPNRDLELPGVPPQYFQRLSFNRQHCGGLIKYHPAFDTA